GRTHRNHPEEKATSTGLASRQIPNLHCRRERRGAPELRPKLAARGAQQRRSRRSYLTISNSRSRSRGAFRARGLHFGFATPHEGVAERRGSYGGSDTRGAAHGAAGPEP